MPLHRNRHLAAAPHARWPYHRDGLRAVYTPRAHADGTVDRIVDEARAFPHQQPVETFQAQVDACLGHDAAGRLSRISAPTLVLAGEVDTVLPPRLGALVAAEIADARFEVVPSEAHQPFQEVRDRFNARVDAFGSRPTVGGGRHRSGDGAAACRIAAQPAPPCARRTTPVPTSSARVLVDHDDDAVVADGP